MRDASQLGPEQRRASLTRLGDDVFDVVVIGGGAVGTGCALDAVDPRTQRGAGRSARLRGGYVLAVEQKARARRPALPRAARFRARPRSAARARAAARPVLAPHLVAPVPFLLPLTEHWQRRLHRRGARAVRHARRARGAAAASPPDPARRAAARSRAAQGRAGGRDPVLRRQGRRRPPHADRGPHRRPPRRGRRRQRAGAVGLFDGQRGVG